MANSKARLGAGKHVELAGFNRAGLSELKQTEFAEIRDEDEAVLLEVTKDLRLAGEGIEVVVGGLDFDNATFGIAEDVGLRGAAPTAGLGEEAAIWHPCALIAQFVEKRTAGLSFFPAILNSRSTGG